MKESTKLIVLSHMRPKGDSGVQTHALQVLALAQARGVESVLRTPYDRQRTAFSRAQSQLLKRVRNVAPYFAESRLWALDDAELARGLGQELSGREGTVVLYAQSPRSALVAKEAASRAGITHRLVWTAHFNVSEATEAVNRGSIEVNSFGYRRRERDEAKAMEIADAVTTPSLFLRDILCTRHLDFADKVVHVPNFVNLPETAHSADGGVVEVRWDLISIGSLERRKNQAFLLDVLYEAKKLGHSYSLNLVGDGPDRELLEGKVDHLQLRDQVTFSGAVLDAGTLIAHARAFVHSSLQENLPIAIIEALAAGRPVFAGAVGGIPELISDDIEGFIWPLEDPKSAAQILINIFNTSDRLSSSGLAARRRFRKNFSPEAAGNRLLSTLLGAHYAS
ncbi:MAG: glycosyltransferase family 1 protein [Proteobacteria bacterium]|nr:MAG: glycosyltransferase family 1 protein [Pseudomonadota bacterium]